MSLPSGAMPGSRRSKLVIKELLYAENGIRVEVGICFLEDVSCERFVSRRRDHEVHMRRTHRATVRGVKQLAYRSILGNRIGRGFDGPEEVFSFRVGVEVTTTINVLVLLLLHIVETMLIGLPDFDECIGNRLALR